MLKNPKDYSTLFIDMDSFFASVEQQFNPSLRHKPVAVCAGLADNCTIVAASIQAKQSGVKAGTKVAQARLLCPEIILVNDCATKYRQIHQYLMALLGQTSAVVVPKSIDEAYLKMPEYLSYSSLAFALSKAIKANIKKYVGEYLNCSIGIAPNIWLAKMASNYKKPDGLVCVRKKDIPSFLSNLNLLDFNGISHALARRFYKIGIYEPLDLYNADFGLLKSAFGINGVKWYLRLRGYEVDDLTTKRQKSLGHQTTLSPKRAHSLGEIKAVIAKMSHRIGYRLRKKRLQARKLVIALKFRDGDYWLKKYSQSRWFSSDYEIKSICLSQVSKLKNTKLVCRIYVTVYDLEEEVYLGKSLFEDLSYHGDLSRAIDQINSKFGRDSIILASSLGKDFLPDRVGFGNSN